MSFYDMSFPNSLCFLVTSPLIPQDFLKPQLVFQGFFEKEELVHLFKSVHGTGEITQELRSLTILPEDLGSVHSINMAHTHGSQLQGIHCPPPVTRSSRHVDGAQT